MKIQLISDVHVEWYSDGGWKEVFKPLPVLGDVLVIAGDLTNCHTLKGFLLVLERICKKWKHVIYVPGNHDYWGTFPDKAWTSVIGPAEEKLGGALTALRSGRTKEIDGHRFIGDTMWYPENPLAWPLVMSSKDKQFIHSFIPWVFDQNREWLAATSEIKKGDIVVTHYAPSYVSCLEKYKDSKYNALCVDGRMEKVIMDKQPKLWLHGHLHGAVDYMIDQTRIVCNPYGYPMERILNETGFDINKVIEI